MTKFGGAARRHGVRGARVLMLAMLVAVFVSPVRAAGSPGIADPRVELWLEPQELSSALRQLALVAKLEIGFSPETVRGRKAPELRGTFSVTDALARLLAGSGLVVRYTVSGALLVEDHEREPIVILPEMHVTGWRLPQPVSEGSAAVQSFDAVSLQRSAPGTLMDALSRLPQFANNNSAVGFFDGASGSSGASNLNLRGIGPERTLLLLDGRRVVPTIRRGYVDINLLPQALIRRVDVVTGGASAAYGSDAVSGVANLVLDTGLNGLRLTGHTGISGRGDNAGSMMSMAFGARLGPQTRVLGSLEAYESDGIRDYSGRSWFRSWGTIANPEPSGPRLLTVPDLRSRGYTSGGLITRGPLAGIQFLEGGVPAPFEPGLLVAEINQQGGSGFDQGSQLWIIPDQRRHSGLLYLVRDFGRGGRLFAQALRGRSAVEFAGHPQAFYTTATATIQRDNAFLPAAVGQLMDEAGVTSFPLARMSSSRDIGAPLITNDSRMDSLTMGVDAPAGRWTVSAYYQYGLATQARRYRDIVRLDRIYRALDSVRDPVTGQPVCRSTLSFPDDGCVPLDVFGDGAPSSAARDYVRTSFVADQRLRQDVLDVSMSGGLFGMPAGEASFSTGVAYRREYFSVNVRPYELAALRVEDPVTLGYGGVPPRDVGSGIFERSNYWSDADGRYRVLEGFVETLLPLWREQDSLRALSMAVASRYSYYSGSGRAWTWKLGLDWQAANWLQLRVTRSRDIRAGNLAERFDSTGAAARVDRDPLSPEEPTYGVVAIQAGNPAVRPERADTLTFGFEMAPTGPGLTLAADYYDIRIGDAITQMGVSGIIDQCYAGDGATCGLIRRDPVSGRIIDVQDPYINAANARATGIDVRLRHSGTVQWLGRTGAIEVNALANHVLEASTYLPGVPRVERTRQTGRGFAAPSWRASLRVQLRSGSFSMHLEEQFISSGLRDATLVEGVDIDDNTVAAAWYSTLGASWTRPTRFGVMEVFATVGNLFDKDPPRAPLASALGTTHTNEELFDPIGRRFALGVRFER